MSLMYSLVTSKLLLPACLMKFSILMRHYFYMAVGEMGRGMAEGTEGVYKNNPDEVVSKGKKCGKERNKEFRV